MYFYSGFNPFNPPGPPPAKPIPAEKKEQPKPPGNAAPPRMMIFIGAGKEALLALPQNYTQAIKVATEKFEIPSNFHVRLAVKRGEEPGWLSKFVQQDYLFIADDVSYQYCCAGRQVITMYVMVFEKPDQPTLQPTKPGK
ncbi:hypothetical protein QFC20_006369 [Naganishia adeliensis]|uniref:Uncharacterized protein n=1 Tax=Naganishia adeliensis TaxID=92952 RepID=A0ACC2VBB3_9TREE|nr:hypothetical protein QFC20_006369 [Naganishia adeliensis]